MSGAVLKLALPHLLEKLFKVKAAKSNFTKKKSSGRLRKSKKGQKDLEN